jgi:hypothetical protein
VPRGLDRYQSATDEVEVLLLNSGIRAWSAEVTRTGVRFGLEDPPSPDLLRGIRKLENKHGIIITVGQLEEEVDSGTYDDENLGGEWAKVLKDVRRILKSRRGNPFSEEAYDRLVERITEELYGDAVSQERAVRERKESLVQRVTREVEAAHAAEFQARAHKAAERERLVTQRERRAKPSYRARFAAAGAGAVLALDVLLRVVA